MNKEKLIEELRYHSRKYFLENSPVISDEEFDVLKEKFISLYGEDEYLRNIGIGFDVDENKVPHRYPMGSLSNCFTVDDVAHWMKKFPTETEFYLDWKLDGVSLSLKYSDGKFVQAVTRGNGKRGTDVTENAHFIDGIPKEIPFNEELIVRGEVLIPKSFFEKELSDDFSNPRNLAAGTLMQIQDPSLCSQRGLTFLAFGIDRLHSTDIHSEVMGFLIRKGFNVSPMIACGVFSLSELNQIFEDSIKKRDELDFDTDGIVIKVDDGKLRIDHGDVSLLPEWATAWKFPAQSAISQVLDVKFQLGRTGVLTPVAEISPVRVSGVIIQNVTLHNMDEINRLGLKIGSKVKVERSGDVIPKIVFVVETPHDAEEIHIEKIKCPSCGSSPEKDGVFWRCSNDSCSGKTLNRLIHFARVCDFKGFSSKQIEKFHEAGALSRLDQFFTLRRRNDHLKLENLPGMGKKSVERIFSVIDQRRKISFSVLLSALGIRMCSSKICEKIAEHFETPENLIKAVENSMVDLQVIPGIGRKVERAFMDHFENEMLMDEFKSLLTHVEMEEKQFSLKKKVVITGKLPISRREACEILQRKGFEVSGTVNSSVDVLVVGEKPGAKLQKAQHAGIEIWNVERFLEEISNMF